MQKKHMKVYSRSSLRVRYVNPSSIDEVNIISKNIYLKYVNQIKAYFAYALDRPSECLSYVRGVSFVEQLTASHPALLVTAVDEKSKEISGPHMPTAIDDKNIWIFMEALRSICLEGTFTTL